MAKVNIDIVLILVFLFLFIGTILQIFISSPTSLKEQYFNIFLLFTYIFGIIYQSYKYRKSKVSK